MKKKRVMKSTRSIQEKSFRKKHLFITNPLPQGTPPEDEHYKLLELLNEIDSEATAMNKKDVFLNNVALMLLMRLEILEEDFAANQRIVTEATYMIFVQEVNKTVNLSVQKEIKYLRFRTCVF